jgi:dihydroneopterin aldolase
MSDYLEIHGISGFGYHGLFEQERANGQRFKVDLKIELKNKKVGKSDAIADAVDYAEIIKEVYAIIVGEPVNLIERVAELIAERLLNQFKIKSVEVLVHKSNAPVGYPIDDIAIRVKRSL